METHTRLMSMHTSFLSFVTIKFGSLKREMESVLFSHRANTCSCRTRFLLMHGLSRRCLTYWVRQSFSLSNIRLTIPKNLQSSEFWISDNIKAISYNGNHLFFCTISLLWVWTGDIVMKYLLSHGWSIHFHSLDLIQTRGSFILFPCQRTQKCHFCWYGKRH